MIRVDFYRSDDDDPFGTVEYDDVANEFLIESKDAGDHAVLTRILSGPVFATVGGKLHDVYASQDPVLFMFSLSKHYKSAQGIRATEPLGDEVDAAMVTDDEEDGE